MIYLFIISNFLEYCCIILRFGVVKYEAVMELCMEMDQLEKMKGITQAEKGSIVIAVADLF